MQAKEGSSTLVRLVYFLGEYNANSGDTCASFRAIEFRWPAYQPVFMCVILAISTTKEMQLNELTSTCFRKKKNSFYRRRIL